MKDSVHLNSCVVPLAFLVRACSASSVVVAFIDRHVVVAAELVVAVGLLAGAIGLPVIGGRRQALTAKTNRQAMTAKKSLLSEGRPFVGGSEPRPIVLVARVQEGQLSVGVQTLTMSGWPSWVPK